jgi:hypothetical protein
MRVLPREFITLYKLLVLQTTLQVLVERICVGFLIIIIKLLLGNQS